MIPPGISIRSWKEEDFPFIQHLSSVVGWRTALNRPSDALEAWRHSSIGLVALNSNHVIGFLRAIGDGSVTTYVCEILVAAEWRGKGIGQALLEECHRRCPNARIDLLSTASADQFYLANGFRPFQGFRKSYV